MWWYHVDLQILDTPSLLAEGSAGVKKNIFKEKPPQPDASTSGCCSWWLYSLCFSHTLPISISFTSLVWSKLFTCWSNLLENCIWSSNSNVWCDLSSLLNKCIFSPSADALISHLLLFKSSKSELYLPQFCLREDDVSIRHYGLLSYLYHCVGPDITIITIRQQQQANKLGFVLQNQSMS